jgi:hypothetical protein
VYLYCTTRLTKGRDTHGGTALTWHLDGTPLPSCHIQWLYLASNGCKAKLKLNWYLRVRCGGDELNYSNGICHLLSLFCILFLSSGAQKRHQMRIVAGTVVIELAGGHSKVSRFCGMRFTALLC